MKKISGLFLAILAISCAVENLETQVDLEQTEQALSYVGDYEEGKIVVKFTEQMYELIGADLTKGSVGTKSSELTSFATDMVITSIKPLYIADSRFEKRHKDFGLHLWYEITYSSSEAATKAASTLSALEGVQGAQPVHKIVRYGATPNDRYYSNQWSYNTSTGNDINVLDVWENYTTGDPSVIVSVHDGGIMMSHPDLTDNLIPVGTGGSWNFYADSPSVTADSHGTHVAGVIGAVRNNETGIAGIAGGDYAAGQAGTSLMSCQIFSGDNSGGQATSLVYAADNGAIISQNSWGYSYNDESSALKGSVDYMQTSIDYFIKCAGCDDNYEQLPTSKMKGGVVIFAAGNGDGSNGWKMGWPAAYEPCIAVGAVNEEGSRAQFSNYGDWVDICAPGFKIYSTYYNGSTYAYEYESGTSMACPAVSGVAALVAAYRGGPGFTADNLKECLLEGANPDKISALQVGPYLDALGAVLYGGDLPAEPGTEFSVSAQSNNVTVDFTVPASEEGGSSAAYGAMVCASTSKASLESLNPKSLPSDVSSALVTTSEMSVGDKASVTVVVGEAFETEVYVTILSYNYGSNFASSWPEPVSVTTGPNSAPVITSSASLDDLLLSASTTISTLFTIEEPDNHDFTVSYSYGSAAETWTQRSSSEYLFSIYGASADPGTYSTSISATDAYGATTTIPITYTIKANNAPELIKEFEGVVLTLGSSSTRSAEIDLSEYFEDPDGDTLSYSVENPASTVCHAVVTEGVLYLTGRASGSISLALTASDPRGLSVSSDFQVIVRESGNSTSVYPSVMSTVLYVGTGSAMDTYIKVTSETGKVVYEETSVVSAFSPATIDVSSWAPGRYVVYVSYADVKYTQTVV